MQTGRRFINRPTKTGGRDYDKFFVYNPTEVARDKTFPSKEKKKEKKEVVIARACVVLLWLFSGALLSGLIVLT